MRFQKNINIAVVLLILILTSCAKPLAKFNTEQSSQSAPSKIVLQNESQNAETYFWDFGDGNTSDEESPTHVYNESGKYKITLKVTKKEKSNSASKEIEVGISEKCLIEISTEYGVMIAQLSDETPNHRENFLKLAEEGFYNDLLFHRVVEGFVIQGGDPISKNADSNASLGSGGPGYLVPAEFTGLAHVKGALAAARPPQDPEKRSSGSQFYIVQGRSVSESDLKRNEARMDRYYTPEQRKEYLENGGTPFLDGEYTVFGKLISGFDVLDKISAVKTDGDPPKGQSRPKKNVAMKIRVLD